MSRDTPRYAAISSTENQRSSMRTPAPVCPPGGESCQGTATGSNRIELDWSEPGAFSFDLSAPRPGNRAPAGTGSTPPHPWNPRCSWLICGVLRELVGANGSSGQSPTAIGAYSDTALLPLAWSRQCLPAPSAGPGEACHPLGWGSRGGGLFLPAVSLVCPTDTPDFRNRPDFNYLRKRWWRRRESNRQPTVGRYRGCQPTMRAQGLRRLNGQRRMTPQDAAEHRKRHENRGTLAAQECTHGCLACADALHSNMEYRGVRSLDAQSRRVPRMG